MFWRVIEETGRRHGQLESLGTVTAEAVGLNLVDGAIFNRKSESFCAIAADEEVWHHGKAGI